MRRVALGLLVGFPLLLILALVLLLLAPAGPCNPLAPVSPALEADGTQPPAPWLSSTYTGACPDHAP
jgi:hypothetical protein